MIFLYAFIKIWGLNLQVSHCIAAIAVVWVYPVKCRGDGRGYGGRGGLYLYCLQKKKSRRGSGYLNAIYINTHMQCIVISMAV